MQYDILQKCMYCADSSMIHHQLYTYGLQYKTEQPPIPRSEASTSIDIEVKSARACKWGIKDVHEKYAA